MKTQLLLSALCALPLLGSAEILAVRHDMYGGNANAWQVKRHAEKMNVVTNGGAKVVFIGDSITHFWESNGKAQLAKYFSEGDAKMLDLGISADRTEHLVWRGLNGELDGYRTKAVVLMIGTNNGEGAEEIAAGIRRVLDVIAEKQPQAKTILHPIFPRGASGDRKRSTNDATNAIIRNFADGEKVIWCDFNAKLVDEQGDTKWIMPDRLHPNAEGYKTIWLPAIQPLLKEICGK